MTAVGSATAVVVNWRTAELARRAAEALIGDALAPERVVVVDNASGDGGAERLEAALPRCRVVRLGTNAGYGAGCNAGARSLPGTAYLFANSDAFVHRPGSVAALVDALGDPRAGISVPRLLNEDLTLQPSVVPRSTPLPELVRASGLSRFLPNDWQPSLSTHWDHARSRRVQAAIGAVLCVRADVWDLLGGFDERRFMYAEEHDLYWRAAERGLIVRFVAEAEFVHLGGASTGRRWSDTRRAAEVARADAAVIRDHLGPVSARITLGLMALGVGLRAAAHGVLGDRDAAATERALLRGYLGGVR